MKKIIILIFIFCLTGCYNYRELNELAITSGMAIDKENDEYILTIQVVNDEKTGTGNSSSSDNSKFIIYEGRGKNLQQTLRNAVEDIPRIIYTNSMQILIISEDVAKEGIYNILDLIFRKTELNKQFYTIISKDTKASDILKVVTPLETLNAKKIVDSLKVDSKYYGLAELITYEDMLSVYLNKNKEIVLPSIYIENKTDESNNASSLKTTDVKTKLKLGPTAIFKDDKMLGYLSKEQSISLSYIKNKIIDSITTYECEKDKFISIELNQIKSKTNIIKNKPIVTFNISANGIITETQCKLNLEDTKIIEEIKNNAEEKLKNQIESSILDIRDTFNSDIFGIKDLYYKNNLKYYKNIKDDWYINTFPNLEIKVIVNIDLNAKGNAIKEINREEN